VRAVVAVDVLHRRVGTKKYTKTIYLITAAEDPIENPGDLQATVQHMVQQVCGRGQRKDISLAPFTHALFK
jgi:hypothetical protein